MVYPANDEEEYVLRLSLVCDYFCMPLNFIWVTPAYVFVMRIETVLSVSTEKRKKIELKITNYFGIINFE